VFATVPLGINYVAELSCENDGEIVIFNTSYLC